MRLLLTLSSTPIWSRIHTIPSPYNMPKRGGNNVATMVSLHEAGCLLPDNPMPSLGEQEILLAGYDPVEAIVVACVCIPACAK